jgi:hypothetical protein
MIRILKFSPGIVYSESDFQDKYSSRFDENLDKVINQPNTGRLNAWSDYLNDRDFWCKELIVDSVILQRQWATEILGGVIPDNGLIGIMLEQISYYNPHIIYAHDQVFFKPEIIALIRTKYKNLKILTYDGIFRNNYEYAKIFDLVICPSYETAQFYTENKLSVSVLRFGINKKYVNQFGDIPFESRERKLLFAGSLVGKLHTRRYDYIEYLSRKSDTIKLAVDYEMLESMSMKHRSNSLLNRIYRKILDTEVDKSSAEKLSRINMGRFDGRAYLSLIGSFQNVLNVHINTVKKEAANIRLFEAAFMKTSLLTDYFPNLDELLGKENYTSFINKDDCLKKAKYLIDNPVFAAEKAIMLHEQVVKNHEYSDIFAGFRHDLLNLFR